jgi:hypothetical protein
MAAGTGRQAVLESVYRRRGSVSKALVVFLAEKAYDEKLK